MGLEERKDDSFDAAGCLAAPDGDGDDCAGDDDDDADAAGEAPAGSGGALVATGSCGCGSRSRRSAWTMLLRLLVLSMGERSADLLASGDNFCYDGGDPRMLFVSDLMDSGVLASISAFFSITSWTL